MIKEVKNCIELYEEFKIKNEVKNSEIIKFKGVEGFDVYNPSVPFNYNGELVMAGRVEERDNEVSETRIFVKGSDSWVLKEDSIRLVMKDPFMSLIKGEIVLGGYPNVFIENSKGDFERSCINYFFTGENLNELKLTFKGPIGMKDIRLVEMKDGRIGVFSRPRNSESYFEKYGVTVAIGFEIVNSLEEITPELISEARPLYGVFPAENWGGCNQVYVLENGNLGVIGHIADKSINKEELNYYAVSFCVNPDTREVTDVKMIACRESFPEGPAKKPGLKNVVFSAGIIDNKDGTVDLYAGLNDCQVGKCTIPNPFII